jgi:hypothetical protein
MVAVYGQIPGMPSLKPVDSTKDRSSQGHGSTTRLIPYRIPVSEEASKERKNRTARANKWTHDCEITILDRRGSEGYRNAAEQSKSYEDPRWLS